MADEIETALSSIIERAPVTPQIGDEDFQPTALPPPKTDAPPAQDKVEVKPGDAKPAEEVKPEDQKPQDPLVELEALRKKFADKDGMAAAERAKRRQAEAERQQLADQLAYFQQQMAAQQARQRAQQFKAPDPEENVVEAVKYERMLRMAQERQQAQAQAAQAQQYQQLEYVNRLKTSVEDMEAEFREAHPDYDEHADFVVDFEQQRLEMMGVPKPQAEQMAINWAINAADMMLKQGVNPAQAAYEQAKRMGYTPKAAKAAAEAAADAAMKTAQAQANLQQKKNGQAAAATLSGGGSSSGEDNTLSTIANLKGAAFDSAINKWLSGR